MALGERIRPDASRLARCAAPAASSRSSSSRVSRCCCGSCRSSPALVTPAAATSRRHSSLSHTSSRHKCTPPLGRAPGCPCSCSPLERFASALTSAIASRASALHPRQSAHPARLKRTCKESHLRHAALLQVAQLGLARGNPSSMGGHVLLQVPARLLQRSLAAGGALPRHSGLSAQLPSLGLGLVHAAAIGIELCATSERASLQLPQVRLVVFL